eukprot:TRINITY_DN38825_c0_g1_i2.p1 TRINITY_DN38825_c0_g1~~TRINITY_DN38825_c0_g1_i2.p1  ORF type:complete len:150 (+),score=40.90 TRINITY_DN38825_c0_g1_i2:66-515(+)
MDLGFFFFQAEDGIRDVERSRGLGDVYKRQYQRRVHGIDIAMARELDSLNKTISSEYRIIMNLPYTKKGLPEQPKSSNVLPIIEDNDNLSSAKTIANIVTIAVLGTGIIGGGIWWIVKQIRNNTLIQRCLLYTSPSPRDLSTSRMPSSA